METLYDDSLLPENFEQIAKAYSKSLKNKGFVFIRLQDEEFDLLLGEIFVILAKMSACLRRLERFVEGKELFLRLQEAQTLLSEKFGRKKPYNFDCMVKESNAFLCLVSLFGTLIIKLMLLSVKSGELELCNQICVSISSVFADSFSLEGFIPVK